VTETENQELNDNSDNSGQKAVKSVADVEPGFLALTHEDFDFVPR